MRVNNVDGTRTSSGEHSKVIALREQGIEGTESICHGIVATGDVSLGAESRFQRSSRKPVPGLRCHRPCPDVCRSEASKLPKRFMVEIPASLRLSNGTG